MRGHAAFTSLQVSLPSASVSRSMAMSRSRRAMSQRTASSASPASSCKYESLDLWAEAVDAQARRPNATSTHRQAATRNPLTSEQRIDAAVVQAKRLPEAARFFDRRGVARCARRFGEHQQVEWLALLRHVAAGQFERAPR